MISARFVTKGELSARALARFKIEQKKIAVAHTEDRVDVSAVRVPPLPCRRGYTVPDRVYCVCCAACGAVLPWDAPIMLERIPPASGGSPARSCAPGLAGTLGRCAHSALKERPLRHTQPIQSPAPNRRRSHGSPAPRAPSEASPSRARLGFAHGRDGARTGGVTRASVVGSPMATRRSLKSTAAAS